MHKFAIAGVIVAEAQRPGKSCDLTATFADMHDGDEKDVVIAGDSMIITPHSSTDEWTVKTTIDCDTKLASVDFNVPGKADHPPVPIIGKLHKSISASARKSTFIFTDNTGQLVDDPTFPLNQWVAEVNDSDETKFRCPDKIDAVFADMHDGDKKAVTLDGTSMTIKPSGNDQVWTIEATLDPVTCSASVEFNVPGKDDHPPVPLTATLFMEYSAHTRHIAFEFNDPSATIAPATSTLNRWIELAKTAVHV